MTGTEKLTGSMKLTLIQNEMKAPKSQYNQFGKFNYRTTDEIQYFLKPLCAKYHTQVVPTTESIVMGWADTLVGVYQKATVSMLDADTGELIAESTAMAREDDDRKGMSAPQVSASAAQFAVKRALEQLLMLDGSAPEVDVMRPTGMVRQAPQPRQAQQRVPQPRQVPQPVQAPRQPRPVQPVQASQNAAQATRKAPQASRQQPTVNRPQKPVQASQKQADPDAEFITTPTVTPTTTGIDPWAAKEQEK